MAVPRDIRQRIEKGDLDAVESAWLEHATESPADVDWFVGIGRFLAGSGHADVARTLLEMLSDELRGRGLARERLDLLREAGEVMVSKSRLHETIVEALREAWAGHPSFEPGLAGFGLQKSARDPVEIWDRVSRLESVLRYVPGTIVWVEGHGAGRVGDVNMELESFRIVLHSRRELRVGFRAAGKLLQALAADHFLVPKMDQPQAVAALAPAELLARIHSSFARPDPVAEVRDLVEGLVPSERWSTWWSAARKHPQVVASPAVRNAYVWAGSSEEATAAGWRQFQSAAPAAQIELLRRSEGQDPELVGRMVEALRQRARAALATEPNLAFEIALALERVVSDPELQPEKMIAAAVSPDRLVATIASKTARARGFEIVRQKRADWQQVFAGAALAETEPSLLAVLFEALEADQSPAAQRLVDRAMTRPADAPALFTWLAERAATDETLRAMAPLRLWKRVLLALGRDELQPYRRRLIALSESGGTLPRRLSHFSETEATVALESLRKTSGLGTDRKRPLEDAIHLRFPALRSEELPLYALETSIKTKREELKHLVEQEIPKNRKAIEEARAMGDLRENFEYKAARQRHEYLNARAEAMSNELARSKAIDLANLDLSRIGIGTTAVLRDSTGDERRLTFLGPWESAPEAGILSYLSEVGQLLLGQRPGDEVEIEGRTYRVEAGVPAGA
jgi:transcription elongation GreA/GreB family factor